MRYTITVVVFTLLFAGEIPRAADQSSSPQLTKTEVVALSKLLTQESADLTVTGKIISNEPIFFSLETFMKLPFKTIETTNYWTKEKEKFTGVGFFDLLNFIGLEETTSKVEIVAANNYTITIRLSDLERYEYILSYELDGKLYNDLPPERNKGPIAIAINFDKHPELDREIYKHQLVWFVDTLIVR